MMMFAWIALVGTVVIVGTLVTLAVIAIKEKGL